MGGTPLLHMIAHTFHCVKFYDVAYYDVAFYAEENSKSPKCHSNLPWTDNYLNVCLV